MRVCVCVCVCVCEVDLDRGKRQLEGDPEGNWWVIGSW